MNASVIDKVAWICMENGRLLAVQSKGKALFYLPGGKREPGESDEAALRREVEEELSVRLLPDSIAPFGVFSAEADGKAGGVQVRMTCLTARHEGELAAASEIEEWAWLSAADRDRMSAASRLIADRLAERGELK
ncbi:NUDIX hydrolase [Paenibacillus glufosinatiresistens]|uniref:NUDIX hydrolase n=1 Tax=Paenibacillus glufosinatiresistens TaxID=3070657 RepID=UPI00286DA555|nr:NUDIX domain-containing protein [Paenibacillus sp. YX.27]